MISFTQIEPPPPSPMSFLTVYPSCPEIVHADIPTMGNPWHRVGEELKSPLGNCGAQPVVSKREGTLATNPGHTPITPALLGI